MTDAATEVVCRASADYTEKADGTDVVDPA